MLWPPVDQLSHWCVKMKHKRCRLPVVFIGGIGICLEVGSSRATLHISLGVAINFILLRLLHEITGML